MYKLKIFLFRFLILIIILFTLEIAGYIYLYNFDLNGSFSQNKGFLLKIKDYISNNENAKTKPKYIPHLTVGYIHNPDYVSDGVKQNNNFGWRGEMPSIEKDSSVFRIVCLGGSTTYGYGVNSATESYPFFLEIELRKKYPEKNIEVINAGVEGYTSFDELKSYLFVVKYLNPDAIVIKSGGNDAADNTTPAPGMQVDYSPDLHLSHLYYYDLFNVNPKLRFLMKSNFICSLNFIVNYNGTYNNDAARIGAFIRKKTEKHIWFDNDLNFALENQEYYSFRRNFETLISLLTKDSVKVYALPFAIIEDHTMIAEWDLNNYVNLNRINNIIMKEVVTNYGQVWIPLETDSIPDFCWLGDDCHFNSKGNEFKAKFISRYIKF